MGIHGLLQLLPYSDVDWLTCFPGESVRIDADNLIWVCAFRHKKPYCSGDYSKAVREFGVFLRYFKLRNRLFTIIFGGRAFGPKSYEYLRRAAAQESSTSMPVASSDSVEPSSIIITPLFRALCARACFQLDVLFEVGPYEADQQLCRTRDEFASGQVIVSPDADMFAHGARRLIVVDVKSNGYTSGKAKLYNLDTMASMPTAVESLVPAILKFNGSRDGGFFFRLIAGVLGHDYSSIRCGIHGIGKSKLIHLLGNIDHSCLTVESFGEAIISEVPTLRSTDVESELRLVLRGFDSGTFYNADSEECSVTGSLPKIPASEISRRHFSGLSDPKTRADFDERTDSLLRALQMTELLRPTALDASMIEGATLSNVDPDKCTVVELKMYLAARGASTDMNKPDLVKAALAFQRMENEGTPVNLIDRSGGLTLASVTTKAGTPITVMLEQLIAAPETNSVSGLIDLLGTVQEAYRLKNIIEDMETIIERAPEVPANFLMILYAPLGSAQSAKYHHESISKCAAQNTRGYHANIILAGRTIIVSLENASMMKDESTRKGAEVGEKPAPESYLVISEIFTSPTTKDDDGHELGCFTYFGKTWCRCPAGDGLCIHKGMQITKQHAHWSSSRPTPKPSTQSLQGWARANKRKANMSDPISACTVERIEPSKPNKTENRWFQGHHGSGLEYDLYSSEEDKAAMASLKPSALDRLYAAIARGRGS
jgi:hypothetical protein